MAACKIWCLVHAGHWPWYQRLSFTFRDCCCHWIVATDVRLDAFALSSCLTMVVWLFRRCLLKPKLPGTQPSRSECLRWAAPRSWLSLLTSLLIHEGRRSWSLYRSLVNKRRQWNILSLCLHSITSSNKSRLYARFLALSNETFRIYSDFSWNLIHEDLIWEHYITKWNSMHALGSLTCTVFSLLADTALLLVILLLTGHSEVPKDTRLFVLFSGAPNITGPWVSTSAQHAFTIHSWRWDPACECSVQPGRNVAIYLYHCPRITVHCSK